MAHAKSSYLNNSDSEKKTDQILRRQCRDHFQLFGPEQIRIVLFKECRFKECQLLFDSSFLQYGKNTLDDLVNINNKHNEEIVHLTEMIFGSSPMRYNDTYFKMHDVSAPHHIIFTQVFSAPYRKKISTSLDTRIIGRSFDLLKWRQSNADSGFSFGEDLLENSSRSSSLFSLRKLSWNDTNSTTTTMDSGYDDQSFVNDMSSNTIDSFSRELSSKNELSSGSLSINDSFLSSSKDSRENCIRTNRYTRFGLALIIALATEKDLYRDFYMKHISFIQSILMRLRHYVDVAFNAPEFFMSIMIEISHDSAQWLMDLTNFFFDYKNEENGERPITSRILRALSPENSISGLSYISKVLKKKWNSWASEGLFVRKNRQREPFDIFHSLLKEIEVKDKNFFLSRLLTAVLTYHVGWIETCLNLLDDCKGFVMRTSYNALWCQLIDLCGNAGNTTLNRTIINGDDSEMIKMILTLVQYFVRCFKVQRRYIERDDVEHENEVVNLICDQYGSIILGQGLEIRTNKMMNRSKPLLKQKASAFNLADMADVEDDMEPQSSAMEKKSVMFILGDDEKLVNLTKTGRNLDTIYENTFCEDTEIVSRNCLSLSKLIESSEDGNEAAKNVDKNVSGRNNNGVGLKMKVLMFPLPRVKCSEEFSDIAPFELSLGTSLDKYVPDLIIQGTTMPEKLWKKKLKDDLVLRNRSYFSNEKVEESVAIVADIEKWNVNTLSNRTHFQDKNNMGEPVDASELVCNMLEVVFEMKNLRISTQYCMTHIEQRLLEICLRSNALAQLLLATDFCTMDLLVSILQLEVVDIPLLMSVVSKINPEVSQKYGLSYQ